MGVTCCACSDRGTTPTVPIHNEGHRHPRQLGGRRSVSTSRRPVSEGAQSVLTQDSHERSSRERSANGSCPRPTFTSVLMWPPTRIAPGITEALPASNETFCPQAEDVAVVASPLALAAITSPPSSVSPPHTLTQTATPQGPRSASLRTNSDSRFDSTTSPTGTATPQAGNHHQHHPHRHQRGAAGATATLHEIIEPPDDTTAMVLDEDASYSYYSAGTIVDMRSTTLPRMQSTLVTDGPHRSDSNRLQKMTSRTTSSTGFARSTASDLTAQMLVAGGVSPETDAFGEDGVTVPRALKGPSPPSDFANAATPPSSRYDSARGSHRSSSSSGGRPQRRSLSSGGDGFVGTVLIPIVVPPTATAPASLPRPSIPSLRPHPSDNSAVSSDAAEVPSHAPHQSMLIFDSMGNNNNNPACGPHMNQSGIPPPLSMRPGNICCVLGAVRPLESEEDDELLTSALASATFQRPATVMQPVSSAEAFSPLKLYVMDVSGYQQHNAGSEGDDVGAEDPVSPPFVRGGSGGAAMMLGSANNPLSLPPSRPHRDGDRDMSPLISSHHNRTPASMMVAAALAAGAEAAHAPVPSNDGMTKLPVPATMQPPHGRRTESNGNWEHGSLSLNPFIHGMGASMNIATRETLSPTSQSCNIVLAT